MDVHIDPCCPRRGCTSSVPGMSAGPRESRGTTPASTFTSSTTGTNRHAERFPGAEVVVEPIPEGSTAPSCRDAYVVVVTRGHTHDLDAMRALAARDLNTSA